MPPLPALHCEVQRGWTTCSCPTGPPLPLGLPRSFPSWHWEPCIVGDPQSQLARGCPGIKAESPAPGKPFRTRQAGTVGRPSCPVFKLICGWIGSCCCHHWGCLSYLLPPAPSVNRTQNKQRIKYEIECERQLQNPHNLDLASPRRSFLTSFPSPAPPLGSHNNQSASLSQHFMSYKYLTKASASLFCTLTGLRAYSSAIPSTQQTWHSRHSMNVSINRWMQAAL